jgi:hypothetical protein
VNGPNAADEEPAAEAVVVDAEAADDAAAAPLEAAAAAALDAAAAALAAALDAAAAALDGAAATLGAGIGALSTMEGSVSLFCFPPVRYGAAHTPPATAAARAPTPAIQGVSRRVADRPESTICFGAAASAAA